MNDSMAGYRRIIILSHETAHGTSRLRVPYLLRNLFISEDFAARNTRDKLKDFGME
jgi:hypothetical protein